MSNAHKTLAPTLQLHSDSDTLENGDDKKIIIFQTHAWAKIERDRANIKEKGMSHFDIEEKSRFSWRLDQRKKNQIRGSVSLRLKNFFSMILDSQLIIINKQRYTL